MMRSLSSGVAGLRTHQTRMDVIGNNIANVNTAGFKASRVTFADVYYQNLGGASKGSSSQGGQNPTQIGYGASVATIDMMNNVSGRGSSDSPLDVYLAGEGFLAVKDVNGSIAYTRLGNLGFDSHGNLVDGNGRLVQGFPMKDDGTPNISADGKITMSELQTIHCDPKILDKLTDVSVSPSGDIVGVMEGDKILDATTKSADFINLETLAIPPDSNYNGDVILNIGAIPSESDIGTILGTKTPTSVDYGDIALPASGASVSYTFSFDGTKTFTLKVTSTPADSSVDGDYTGVIKSDGTVVLKNANTGKTAMTLKFADNDMTGITAKTGTLDAGKMKDLSYQVVTGDDGGNVVKLPKNGPAVYTGAIGKLADLDGIDIEIVNKDKDGNVVDPKKPFIGSMGRAQNDEEVIITIGVLAVAKFQNPNGMKEMGSSYFGRTSNSGDPSFTRPGLSGTGEAIASNLEMSNVDLSKEFTDMITTQRGFQANSRIITVSDTMLEELVNLKR